MLAGAVRQAGESGRQPDHVEDRPLADQSEDEEDARASWRAKCPATCSSPTGISVTTTRSTPACRLLEIVAKSGKPLSAQLEGVPKTVSTPELRVDCPDDKKFQVVEKVAEISEDPSGSGCRRRARTVRSRLGLGASFEHAAGIGHALRSDQREIAKRISSRDRRDRGASEKRSGLIRAGL